MLWESIPTLSRILQGFEDTNLMPHALKQTEKENPVDHFFWPEKVSRKNVLAEQLMLGPAPPTRSGTYTCY